MANFVDGRFFLGWLLLTPLSSLSSCSEDENEDEDKDEDSDDEEDIDDK